MGVVSVAKLLSEGGSLSDIGPFKVSLREPSRMDDTYVYFDVSDLLADTSKLYALTAIVSGYASTTSDPYHRYVATLPSRIAKGSVVGLHSSYLDFEPAYGGPSIGVSGPSATYDTSKEFNTALSGSEIKVRYQLNKNGFSVHNSYGGILLVFEFTQ